MNASATAGRSSAGSVVATTIALVVGVGVAFIDSRPGWDDSGVTAVTLLVGAAIAAAVSGRRPWLWALLVGIWTALLEIPGSGTIDSILALAFAGVGAAIGFGLARMTRSG